MIEGFAPAAYEQWAAFRSVLSREWRVGLVVGWVGHPVRGLQPMVHELERPEQPPVPAEVYALTTNSTRALTLAEQFTSAS